MVYRDALFFIRKVRGAYYTREISITLFFCHARRDNREGMTEMVQTN